MSFYSDLKRDYYHKIEIQKDILILKHINACREFQVLNDINYNTEFYRRIRYKMSNVANEYCDIIIEELCRRHRIKFSKKVAWAEPVKILDFASYKVGILCTSSMYLLLSEGNYSKYRFTKFVESLKNLSNEADRVVIVITKIHNLKDSYSIKGFYEENSELITQLHLDVVFLDEFIERYFGKKDLLDILLFWR